MSYSEDDASGRPKLSLQPRGSGADQLPSVPAKTSRPNPFGSARPREQIIAEREGKKETEVLKEQAQKEWKPSIVLTEAQREEKKAAEAELAFAKSELTKEYDPVKSKALKEEIQIREKKLEELIGDFEKVAIQTAQTGGTRRSYERRDDRAPASGTPLGSNYSGDGQEFSNFSRGRDRDADKGGSYGETWGAKVGGTAGGGRLSGSQCYKCGEMGHFSRECPNSGGGGGGRGSYGGNFGGGGRGGGRRECYTCGQEGHFSRECPQGQVGGGYGAPRSSGYGGNSYGGGGYGGGYGASDYEASPYGSGSQGGGSYATGGYDDRGYGYSGTAARGGGGGGYSTGGRWDGYQN